MIFTSMERSHGRLSTDNRKPLKLATGKNERINTMISAFRLSNRWKTEGKRRT